MVVWVRMVEWVGMVIWLVWLFIQLIRTQTTKTVPDPKNHFNHVTILNHITILTIPNH